MSDNTPTARAEKSNSTEVESTVKKSFETLSRITKEYSEAQIAYIIKAVAPTINKEEAYLFIMRCDKLGIDPMSGDITAYASGQGDKRKLTMIVARNWKRERGMSNPHVKSLKIEAIYTHQIENVDATLDANVVKIEDIQKSGLLYKQVGEKILIISKKTVRIQPWEGGTLWGATCTIVRDDYNTPFTVTVPLSEYKAFNVWEKKPETMIRKVAESQCWDLAVPEVSRVYDEAERFDNEKSAPTIEGGEDPATPEQIETIKKLLEAKGRTDEIAAMPEMTKQQAVNSIKELTSGK